MLTRSSPVVDPLIGASLQSGWTVTEMDGHDDDCMEQFEILMDI